MAKAEDPMAVDEKKKEQEVKAEPKKATVSETLGAIVSLLESTTKSKDTRMLAGRLHRQTATIRSQITPEILSQFVSTNLAAADVKASRTFLLEQVGSHASDLSRPRLCMIKAMRWF